MSGRSKQAPGFPVRLAKTIKAPKGERVIRMYCPDTEYCGVEIEIRGAAYPELLCAICGSRMRTRFINEV